MAPAQGLRNWVAPDGPLDPGIPGVIPVPYFGFDLLSGPAFAVPGTFLPLRPTQENPPTSGRSA